MSFRIHPESSINLHALIAHKPVAKEAKEAKEAKDEKKEVKPLIVEPVEESKESPLPSSIKDEDKVVMSIKRKK